MQLLLIRRWALTHRNSQEMQVCEEFLQYLNGQCRDCSHNLRKSVDLQVPRSSPDTT